MKKTDREIFRLALPSILANLTVPLVGLVDTAVAGHLDTSAAAAIGAISLGTTLFNLIYWNVGFLRAGIGGLTAQAFGRKDNRACTGILYRGLLISFAIALIIIVLRRPLIWAALGMVDASPQVRSLVREYFLIRVWAAPATISLMAFSGWFVGMQDSMSSMFKDLIINSVNIAASILLAFGFGRFEGMGFAGIALGTVVAQYCGILYCLVKICLKYGRKVLAGYTTADLKTLLHWAEIKSYFHLNADLFVRSLGFTAIYVGFTLIAAAYGDLILACSSIMMQMLMLFSYFADGFAYAGEALTGRFIGAGDDSAVRTSVNRTIFWSLIVSALFIGIYATLWNPLLSLLTSDRTVVGQCGAFLVWLLLMPPVGCLAFVWDGIYLGATASRQVRNAMVGSAVAFLAAWFLLRYTVCPAGEAALHCLLSAYFLHLLFRTVYLTLTCRKAILYR